MARFCASASRYLRSASAVSAAARFSVTSRNVITEPTSVPFSSRIGEAQNSTGKLVPSGRKNVSSISSYAGSPCTTAYSRHFARSQVRTPGKTGWTRPWMSLPVISAVRRPMIRAAAGLTNVVAASSPTPNTPSAAAFRISSFCRMRRASSCA